MPVPETQTLSGVLVALVRMLRVEEFTPLFVGHIRTAIVQEVPAASLTGQLCLPRKGRE